MSEDNNIQIELKKRNVYFRIQPTETIDEGNTQFLQNVVESTESVATSQVKAQIKEITDTKTDLQYKDRYGN